jgi:hypothetical protein
MKHTATIKTMSKNSREVCKSLNVDNITLKDLSVETGFSKETITTVVKSNSIRSMLNTIDDLLRCQMAAESAIKQ